MAQLDKDDLKQMNRSYFQSLSQERLVEVADNLHQLATELWEKQQQNSENSSQPPSKDNPYSSNKKQEAEHPSSESETGSGKTEGKEIEESVGKQKKKNSSRKPGKQPGGKGFGRQQPLKAEVIIPHYPHKCSACNQDLTESETERYMGYYVLELEPELFGFRIVTSLHHYYRTTCSCGHCNHAKPGTGYISVVEGRSKDLQLTEYVLVGPVLATFIASQSRSLSDESQENSRVFKRLDQHRTEHRNNRQMYSRNRNCLCASSRGVGRTTATSRYLTFG